MTVGPIRVQRTRTTGGGMPAGAVYVGRPSKWGNPFHTHGDGEGLIETIADALAPALVRRLVEALEHAARCAHENHDDVHPIFADCPDEPCVSACALLAAAHAALEGP